MNLANVGFEALPKEFTVIREADCFVVTVKDKEYRVVMVLGCSSDVAFKQFHFVEGAPLCAPREAKAIRAATKVSSENILSLGQTHPGTKLLISGNVKIGGSMVDMSVFNDIIQGKNLPFDIQKDETFEQARLAVNTGAAKCKGKDLLNAINKDVNCLCDTKKTAQEFITPIVQDLRRNPTNANKLVLAASPFKRLLPLLGFEEGTIRSSSTGKLISFLMFSKKLLGKTNLKIFSKKENSLPGMTFSTKSAADCDVIYHPSSVDKEKKIEDNVKSILAHAQNSIVVRCTVSPTFCWSDVYAKYPKAVFFRCGTVLGGTFGVFLDPNRAEDAPNPNGYFANQFAYEFSYASYVLNRNFLNRGFPAKKILVSVKHFAGPTSTIGPLALTDFSLNDEVAFENESVDFGDDLWAQNPVEIVDNDENEAKAEESDDDELKDVRAGQ